MDSNSIIQYIFINILIICVCSNVVTLNAYVNNASNGTNTTQSGDIIEKLSKKCSNRGTFFFGIRTRYVCTNNEIVSQAIYTTRNNAQRITTAVNLALQFFNSQTANNRTNRSSLTNFTYLNDIGSTLLNESSITFPCLPVSYNQSFCACPHE